MPRLERDGDVCILNLGDDEKAYYVGQSVTPVPGDLAQEGRLRPEASRGNEAGNRSADEVS